MKRALVTGATKGIGRAIARMLLAQGYFVTLTYAFDEEARNSCQDELKQISRHFEIIRVDQGNSEDTDILVKHLRKQSHIDCIVCNAGTTLRKDLGDMTNAEWEKVMHINVNSNVFLIRDLYDIIPPHSRIIFIGSLMGLYPHGTSLAYGVTKAATHAIARNLVKFFQGTGTTVNAIAPGFVETEWQKKKPQEIRNNIYNKTAIKRFASVEEIADAVKFCLLNEYVNGSIIEVSGGYCFQ